MKPLEREPDNELRSLCRKWQPKDYRAAYFWRMLTSGDSRYYKGPVGTVGHLLAGEASAKSGFVRLKKIRKLDWTVEALITRDPKWRGLITDCEIRKAEARLSQHRLLKLS